MDRGHLLQIIQPMLAGFKLEIAKMRLERATQAEIDLMLDEFEENYAADDDAEGKLVMAVLSKLLGSPASGQKLPIAVQRKKPRYSTRAEASLGPLGGSGRHSERRDHATECN